MKTIVRPDHRLLVASASAALALVAMGFANNAQARDNVSISVDLGGRGAPGVLIGATNAYPVYSQPRPVYVQPAPVYYRPAPVYYAAPPVYVVPQPVYYQRPNGWKHGHYKKHKKHDHDGDRHGGYQQPGYYSQGYAPVYYPR